MISHLVTWLAQHVFWPRGDPQPGQVPLVRPPTADHCLRRGVVVRVAQRQSDARLALRADGHPAFWPLARVITGQLTTALGPRNGRKGPGAGSGGSLVPSLRRGHDRADVDDPACHDRDTCCLSRPWARGLMGGRGSRAVPHPVASTVTRRARPGSARPARAGGDVQPPT